MIMFKVGDLVKGKETAGLCKDLWGVRIKITKKDNCSQHVFGRIIDDLPYWRQDYDYGFDRDSLVKIDLKPVTIKDMI